jgi:hypothetical protein
LSNMASENVAVTGSGFLFQFILDSCDIAPDLVMSMKKRDCGGWTRTAIPCRRSTWQYRQCDDSLQPARRHLFPEDLQSGAGPGSGLLQQTRYQRTVPQTLQVPHQPLKFVKGKLDAARRNMALGADYSSEHGTCYDSCLIAWDQHLHANVSE